MIPDLFFTSFILHKYSYVNLIETSLPPLFLSILVSLFVSDVVLPVTIKTPISRRSTEGFKGLKENHLLENSQKYSVPG